MSETTSQKTDSANDLQKNTSVARRYFQRQEEIWKLEEELKKLHAFQKRDLAKYPFLGNLVGTVRKASGDKTAAESKKRKTEADAEMEGVTTTSSSSSTPKERIAKRLAQNRPAGQAAEKALHKEQSAHLAQDKF
jgi:hypothetical protein